MSLKTSIPWAGFVVSLAATGVLYLYVQNQDARIAALTSENEELRKVNAEAAEAKETEAHRQTEELVRLRKDNEDLLRLRNEVRQLRGDKQQLAKQVETAQSSVLAEQQQAQVKLEQLNAENQALRTRTAADQQSVQLATCINNLRQIEGATQQWGLENQKPPGSLPNVSELLPYFPNKTFPVCPAGGVYRLAPLGTHPACSVPGHTLGP